MPFLLAAPPRRRVQLLANARTVGADCLGVPHRVPVAVPWDAATARACGRRSS